MKKSFIVDMFASKIYGPYTNKKKMEKDKRLIKYYSDMFLEVSTNIGVVLEDDPIFKTIRFKKGNIQDLIDRKESTDAVHSKV